MAKYRTSREEYSVIGTESRENAAVLDFELLAEAQGALMEYFVSPASSSLLNDGRTHLNRRDLRQSFSSTDQQLRTIAHSDEDQHRPWPCTDNGQELATCHASGVNEPPMNHSNHVGIPRNVHNTDSHGKSIPWEPVDYPVPGLHNRNRSASGRDSYSGEILGSSSVPTAGYC